MKHVKSMKTDPNFLTNHLTLPPPDVPWSEFEDDLLFTEIEHAWTMPRDRVLTPVCKLLSAYSLRMHGQSLCTVYGRSSS